MKNWIRVKMIGLHFVLHMLYKNWALAVNFMYYFFAEISNCPELRNPRFLEQ